MDADPSRASPPDRHAAVPLLESCPACGTPVEGHKCKVYCPNDRCALFRRIIENCAGD